MAQAEYEIYKRIKLLGQGAFGKAFLVECIKDNTLCVIKQVDLNNLPENEKRETIKEAKILEALKHPNIVKFKEVYKTKKGKLCIVMDFADGGDLTKKVEAAKGSSISENQIVDWFTQICLAMKHVHDRKILHRDLKCQNIFLTKNGMIKLGDFGIARVLSSTRENARTMVGTPYYLSPEIIDNKPYSFKSDIWSMGVVLYELCALRPPFDAQTLPQLAMKIVKGQYNPIPSHYSRELRNLVACLLELNPSKRPSVHDVLKMPIITNRIRKFLSESVRLDEFSHTILHNQKPLDLRMRMEDVKQVNNEAPMPQSDLRLLLLQEKKQKENQERAERDKLERERAEKRLRLEREKNEREKMDKLRKERERMEQEMREKENKIFGNRNNLKLQGEGGNQPYSNRPYMGHSPYTPGPNLLNRNKPEVYGNQAQTPNVGANRNNGMFNFFRRDRDEIEKNKVKPVLYAAPSKELIPTKEIINEVNVRRDISPIRDILVRRERNSENPENKAVNNSAQNENASARPSASDKNANEKNDDNMLGLQYRVEETKSDKTDRNHKASPSSNDVQVAKTKVENSSFKEKEKEKEKEIQRRKKVVSRENKEKEKSKKKEELKEMIVKDDSNRVLDAKEARLAEIRDKLAEERKRMREDINTKMKSFKKGGEQFDVEVYLPESPAMDEDEKDDFEKNDEEEDDEKAEDVQQAQPEDEKHNLDMTVEEENLIDMIQEMQKIVDEAPEKEGENAGEEKDKDGEEEETYNYQKDEGAPFKDISNLTENRPLTNFANMSLKDYLEESVEKENSNRILEDSKKLIADLLEDIHLPVEDYSLKLKNQLCEKHSNHSTLPSMAYTFLFQALSEL